jgi:hypothetical protein
MSQFELCFLSLAMEIIQKDIVTTGFIYKNGFKNTKRNYVYKHNWFTKEHGTLSSQTNY